MSSSETLFAPLQFPNQRHAPNRIWLAPMTNRQSHFDGRLGDDEFHFLKARAAGGFGVIETCATHISLDGQGWENELGIYSDEMIPGWQKLARGIQEQNSLLIAQIFHGGARALPREEHGAPWSASPPMDGESGSSFRAGTTEDIDAAIQGFRRAAMRIEEAGGDGVEIHGAHGYLLCQFLSKTWNRRDDHWGGDPLENRARLTLEVIRAIREATSPGFIVGLRLSPENYGSFTGLDLDETLQVAQWACDEGADFIHISLWDGTQNTKKYPHIHPTSFFREHLPKEVPLITAGQIWAKEDAMAQLHLGADAVALGRSAITNPDWPQRVAQRGEEPHRPPLSAEALRDRALGDAFIDYMRRWDGFVLP